MASSVQADICWTVHCPIWSPNSISPCQHLLRCLSSQPSLVISLLWHLLQCLSCSYNKAAGVCLPLVPSLPGSWPQEAKVPCSLGLAWRLWLCGRPSVDIAVQLFASPALPELHLERVLPCCYFLPSPSCGLFVVVDSVQGSFSETLTIGRLPCFPKTLCPVLQSMDFFFSTRFPWMFNCYLSINY